MTPPDSVPELEKQFAGVAPKRAISLASNQMSVSAELPADLPTPSPELPVVQGILETTQSVRQADGTVVHTPQLYVPKSVHRVERAMGLFVGKPAAFTPSKSDPSDFSVCGQSVAEAWNNLAQGVAGVTAAEDFDNRFKAFEITEGDDFKKQFPHAWALGGLSNYAVGMDGRVPAVMCLQGKYKDRGFVMNAREVEAKLREPVAMLKPEQPLMEID